MVNNEERKKKSSAAAIVIVIISILLILAVAAYFLFVKDTEYDFIANGITSIFSSSDDETEDDTKNDNTDEDDSENDEQDAVDEEIEPSKEASDDSSAIDDVKSLKKDKAAGSDRSQVKSSDSSIREYVEIPVSYAWASSQLEIEDYTKYCPENLYDNNLSTAYVEGSDDNGDGQLIRMKFEGDMTYEVTRIDVYPGYQKDIKTFNNNSRPKELEFHFIDGTVLRKEIEYSEGVMECVSIDLKEEFDYPVISTECTIRLVDSISGDKYTDCCISEIKFYTEKKHSDDAVTIGWKEKGDDYRTELNVTAIKDGELIWNYKCASDIVTELESVRFLTMADGIVYLLDDRHVVALDANTGEKLWENDDVYFSATSVAYDKTNKVLYLSGYYEPHLVGYDRNGNLVGEAYVNEDYYWPSIIVYNKDYHAIDIYYDGGEAMISYPVK